MISGECPNCGTPLQRSRIKKGLPCPICTFSPEGTQLAALRSPEADVTCGACGAIVDDKVRLWDGKWYCPKCIARVDSALLEHARKDSHFREQVQVSEWLIARSIVKVVAILVLCVAIATALLSLITKSPGFAIGSFLFLVCLGAFVVPAFAMVVVLGLRSQRPALTVFNGQIMVHVGKRVMDAPLADCAWFEGEASQMNISTCAIALSGPAIVVELPRVFSFRSYRVAVGFTEDTYGLWKSFFMIAGVRQLPFGPKAKLTSFESLREWWLSPW